MTKEDLDRWAIRVLYGQPTKRTSIVKTWMIEDLVVALILIVTAIVVDGGWIEWLGAAAVFGAFSHAQIADRLAEHQQKMMAPDVPCYWKLRVWYVVKEILWLIYFLLHQSYAALVGVVIFLVYPFWRKYWCRHSLPEFDDPTKTKDS